MRLHVLLMLLALPLMGCDKLTGAADQKIADAEAIGFACRVSGKKPEDCMKENEAQSPSYILDGWKSADEDIRSGKLDPGMGMNAAKKEGEEAKPAEGEAKLPEEKKTEAAADAKKDTPKTPAKAAKEVAKKTPPQP